MNEILKTTLYFCWLPHDTGFSRRSRYHFQTLIGKNTQNRLGHDCRSKINTFKNEPQFLLR